jgi:hypothetical protein
MMVLIIPGMKHDQVSQHFTIFCDACQSNDVKIEFDYSCGSDETGVYGESLKLTCNSCGRMDEVDV